MVFIITNSAVSKLKARTITRKTIQAYPLLTNEIILNNYCLKHYKKTLRNICLKILYGGKLMRNNDGNLVLTFIDKNLDNLASFITYGDGKIKGSKILQQAFINANKGKDSIYGM